jgi:hypothetical protein
MWAVIVAGHIWTAQNGQQFFNHRACTNHAAIVGGKCVEVSPGPQGSNQYCVQHGPGMPLVCHPMH